MKLFVTATGTDIGKTFVTAALCRAARRQGLSVTATKPVVSGFTAETIAVSDPAVLAETLGLHVDAPTLAMLSPWRFSAALSPDMAAAREGRSVPFDAVIEHSRQVAETAADILLIEGVGGVMVPLDDRHTVLDWMCEVDLPVLLVAGSYLGTISHTLTALAVLAQAGIQLAAVVLNQSEHEPVSLEETAETLRCHAPTTRFLLFPRYPTEADEDRLLRDLRR